MLVTDRIAIRCNQQEDFDGRVRLCILRVAGRNLLSALAFDEVVNNGLDVLI